MSKISYDGYRFPPEVIHQAIWLYLRFTLSFRDVEDLLAERGIAVSYETVRRWVNHFGPMIAARLRKRRPKPHASWHLDEVYLKIDGRMVYLWRAVDAEGEVLDVLVQSKRNKHAALKLMRKLLKNPSPAEARLLATETELISSGWRGAADRFLVVVTPSKTWPMGCCALESGDVIAAIPVRKLISLRGPAPPLQPRGGIMTKSKRRRPERDFTPTHPHAAAIDIGSRMHVAAVPPDRDSEPVRAFGTCTGDLQQLADWFERCGVRTVAMESTGVYWIPAYELLEQRGFEVVLVNARDAKHVPGRKTDVSDAQWLRRLHEYGLLRASFRPKGELAALRAYLRQRERLLDYSASHIQHMQKALMQMNVQLHHVVTDVTGETGMRIVRAVVAGERDPAVLATHRDRRCHASEAEIAAALAGNWREEHVFALGQALELYDTYHAKVVECDLRIEAVLRRLRDAAAKPAGRLPP